MISPNYRKTEYRLIQNMQMKSKHLLTSWRTSVSLIFVLLFMASPSIAEESYSTSGRLDLRGVAAQNSDSVKEE